MEYELINPPVELRTKDPLITINSRHGHATISLNKIQPKLFKRATKKRKQEQATQILKDTSELFGPGQIFF